MYPLIPREKRVAPAQPKPAPVQPVPPGMVAEFQDRPHGSHGERLSPSPTKGPKPPQPLRIDPPPWQAELESGNLDVAALAPAAPAPDVHPAVAALADQFDPPPPPALEGGPPVKLEPLTYEPFPAPNWWDEERERAEREARA